MHRARSASRTTVGRRCRKSERTDTVRRAPGSCCRDCRSCRRSSPASCRPCTSSRSSGPRCSTEVAAAEAQIEHIDEERVERNLLVEAVRHRNVSGERRRLGELPEAIERTGIVSIAPQLHVRDAQVEHIGWALKAELETDEPLGRLYADSHGLALAAHLLRRYAPVVPKRPISRLPKRRLQRMTAYIHDNLKHDPC